MTRPFGIERPTLRRPKNRFSSSESHSESQKCNPDVVRVFNWMTQSLNALYENSPPWHAYGLGCIVVVDGVAHPISIYKGYQGIQPGVVWEQLFAPEQLKLLQREHIEKFYAVIECEPDEGSGRFEQGNNMNESDIFPTEARDWFVITMGDWNPGDFSDVGCVWYNQEKPWYSITQYLDSLQPREMPNLDWIDKKRRSVVFCVHKTGEYPTVFIDNYSISPKVIDKAAFVTYNIFSLDKERRLTKKRRLYMGTRRKTKDTPRYRWPVR